MMVVMVPFFRTSDIVLPSSGNLALISIHKLGSSGMVSSRVEEVFHSWIISFFAPPNATLLWLDWEAIEIFVQAGRGDALSGTKTEPLMTGKRDVFLI